MTQTKDLIKKMADFFTGEEYYEKGEDARLELSPDDVRCMNGVIKACDNAISRQAVLGLAYDMSEIDGEHFTEPCMVVDVEDIQKLPPVTPQESSNDMVSRGVFEQVMWERDVAIDQLKQLGYGFGEKPRTGHWIDGFGGCECSECGGLELGYSDYCPNCGAKMQEEEE